MTSFTLCKGCQETEHVGIDTKRGVGGAPYVVRRAKRGEQSLSELRNSVRRPDWSLRYLCCYDLKFALVIIITYFPSLLG
jgi:hypothetical protein